MNLKKRILLMEIPFLKHLISPLNFTWEEKKKSIPHAKILVITSVAIALLFNPLGAIVVFYGATYALKKRQISFLIKEKQIQPIPAHEVKPNPLIPLKGLPPLDLQKIPDINIEELNADNLSIDQATAVMSYAYKYLTTWTNKSYAHRHCAYLRCFIELAQKRDQLISFAESHKFVYSNSVKNKMNERKIDFNTLSRLGLLNDLENEEYQRFFEGSNFINQYLFAVSGGFVLFHAEKNDVIPYIKNFPFSYAMAFINAKKNDDLLNFVSSVFAPPANCIERCYMQLLNYLRISDPEWDIVFSADYGHSHIQIISDVFRRYKYGHYLNYFQKTYGKVYNFKSEIDKKCKETDYAKLDNETLKITKQDFINFFLEEHNGKKCAIHTSGDLMITASNLDSLIDEVSDVIGVMF